MANRLEIKLVATWVGLTTLEESGPEQIFDWSDHILIQQFGTTGREAVTPRLSEPTKGET